MISLWAHEQAWARDNELSGSGCSERGVAGARTRALTKARAVGRPP
eukprot:CAMPEP_0119416148 /NCGR_PEP_ID=MMETSP1335-20130426/11949_1 /TAXON_ID=259385 /ORGANISM="Chrysoculter rhomboideus, Strain RCC1486" /LENGTH=45 /DNA_ID= /DNA_START= /DNA_END= /DNA_ORIENTATION=